MLLRGGAGGSAGERARRNYVGRACLGPRPGPGPARSAGRLEQELRHLHSVERRALLDLSGGETHGRRGERGGAGMQASFQAVGKRAHHAGTVGPGKPTGCNNGQHIPCSSVQCNSKRSIANGSSPGRRTQRCPGPCCRRGRCRGRQACCASCATPPRTKLLAAVIKCKFLCYSDAYAPLDKCRCCVLSLPPKAALMRKHHQKLPEATLTTCLPLGPPAPMAPKRVRFAIQEEEPRCEDCSQTARRLWQQQHALESALGLQR